jgi:hypothetical protein
LALNERRRRRLLNNQSQDENSSKGWGRDYNFDQLQRVDAPLKWKACQRFNLSIDFARIRWEISLRQQLEKFLISDWATRGQYTVSMSTMKRSLKSERSRGQ